MAIIAADGFKISKTNTPTREGERIATIAEITDREKVPNPSVGMMIFVEDEQAHYTVLELGPAEIGGIEVPNVVVSKYVKTLGEQAVDTKKLADESVTKEKLSSDLKLSISKLEQAVFPLELTLSVSPSGAQEYTGASEEFTLSWTVKIAGETAVPSKIILTVGGEAVVVPEGAASVKVSATNDKAVSLTVVADGRTATKTANINFARRYYSAVVDASWTPTDATIKALAKTALKTAAAATVTYSAAVQKKIVFAYPASHGLMSAIKDAYGNSMFTLGDEGKTFNTAPTPVKVTLSGGAVLDYNVYESAVTNVTSGNITFTTKSYD